MRSTKASLEGHVKDTNPRIDRWQKFDKSLTNDSLASGRKKVTKTVQEIRENSKLIAADVASNVKDLEKVGLEFAEEKSAIAALHMAKGRP